MPESVARRHCGKLVTPTAEVCPYCDGWDPGKNPDPRVFWTKIIGVLILVLRFAVALAVTVTLGYLIARSPLGKWLGWDQRP
jgi:hypothetical protein